jgi:hypothetical protein
MTGLKKQRWYMVNEDLKYFREKFNRSSGSEEGIPGSISSAFLAEFLKYSEFVESEFNYSFVVKKFPQIYLDELLVK